MNKIYNYFGLSPRATSFDVLKSIHFKRSRSEFPDFVSEFLQNEYLNSNDIRYFNELLWVSNGDITEMMESIEHFKGHFKNNKYPYIFDKEFVNCLNIPNSEYQIDVNAFAEKDIALIGSPFHFILPYFKFKKFGVKVDVINIKYHPSRKIGAIFNNRFISILYKIIFFNDYVEIDIPSKKDLKNFKLPKFYDVGFHKLSFIIGENVTKNFKEGLVNDHWGALPLFKGRSTLHYSKLFGAKKVITNHLIEEGIDSGKILMYSSLKSKMDIYLGLKNRIFNSLNLLCQNKLLDVDNQKGYIFYEMHPWLIDKLKN